MRKLSLTLTLCLALAGTAVAQTPPEVLSAYKSYNSAMADKEYDSALKHGKAAWKAAEKRMGDNKTTGDLAFNYGFLASNRGKPKDAISALERAVELSMVGRENAGEVKLERAVELVSALEALSESKELKKAADEALNFANQQGLGNSVFAGEILVHRAQHCSRIANRAASKVIAPNRSKMASRFSVNNDMDEYTTGIQKKCGRDANKASEIFAANPKLARPKYVALAANQAGFAYERDNDWLNAIISYQSARLAVEDTYGRDNDFVMQIIGRWLNARNQLEFAGKLSKAKAAGLCECWPYGANANKVKATKKVKADLPTRVLEIKSSGYVILEADVTDAGEPKSIRVVHSWPEGQYEENAIKAFQRYEYAPKAGTESEDFRKNVLGIFDFIIYNESTQETY